jgi:hypothetical protein
MPVTPALMPAIHPNRLNRRRAIMTNDPRRLDGIDMRNRLAARYAPAIKGGASRSASSMR